MVGLVGALRKRMRPASEIETLFKYAYFITCCLFWRIGQSSEPAGWSVCLKLVRNVSF